MEPAYNHEHETQRWETYMDMRRQCESLRMAHGFTEFQLPPVYMGAPILREHYSMMVGTLKYLQSYQSLVPTAAPVQAQTPSGYQWQAQTVSGYELQAQTPVGYGWKPRVVVATQTRVLIQPFDPQQTTMRAQLPAPQQITMRAQLPAPQQTTMQAQLPAPQQAKEQPQLPTIPRKTRVELEEIIRARRAELEAEKAKKQIPMQAIVLPPSQPTNNAPKSAKSSPVTQPLSTAVKPSFQHPTTAQRYKVTTAPNAPRPTSKDVGGKRPASALVEKSSSPNAVPVEKRPKQAPRLDQDPRVKRGEAVVVSGGAGGDILVPTGKAPKAADVAATARKAPAPAAVAATTGKAPAETSKKSAPVAVAAPTSKPPAQASKAPAPVAVAATTGKAPAQVSKAPAPVAVAAATSKPQAEPSKKPAETSKAPAPVAVAASAVTTPAPTAAATTVDTTAALRDAKRAIPYEPTDLSSAISAIIEKMKVLNKTGTAVANAVDSTKQFRLIGTLHQGDIPPNAIVLDPENQDFENYVRDYKDHIRTLVDINLNWVCYFDTP